MKQKKKASDQEEFAILEKPRIKHRQTKKSKFRKKIHWTEEENEGRVRKKVREVNLGDHYEDDWDEDDQLLYQWRRQGDVEVVSDAEEDDSEKDNS